VNGPALGTSPCPGLLLHPESHGDLLVEGTDRAARGRRHGEDWHPSWRLTGENQQERGIGSRPWRIFQLVLTIQSSKDQSTDQSTSLRVAEKLLQLGIRIGKFVCISPIRKFLLVLQERFAGQCATRIDVVFDRGFLWMKTLFVDCTSLDIDRYLAPLAHPPVDGGITVHH
jgi:hypothetical protein